MFSQTFTSDISSKAGDNKLIEFFYESFALPSGLPFDKQSNTLVFNYLDTFVIVRKILQFNKRKVETSTSYIFVIYYKLKGKFSSGREGALASKFNYDFK